jgi:hypothetical protein
MMKKGGICPFLFKCLFQTLKNSSSSPECLFLKNYKENIYLKTGIEELGSKIIKGIDNLSSNDY